MRNTEHSKAVMRVEGGDLKAPERSQDEKRWDQLRALTVADTRENAGFAELTIRNTRYGDLHISVLPTDVIVKATVQGRERVFNLHAAEGHFGGEIVFEADTRDKRLLDRIIAAAQGN